MGGLNTIKPRASKRQNSGARTNSVIQWLAEKVIGPRPHVVFSSPA